jgi:hypothetical protein
LLTLFCILFWVIFVFNFIVICIALYYLKKKHPCGIPLLEWIIVDSILAILKVFLVLFTVCFIYRNIRYMPIYYVSVILVVGWLQVIWIFFGYSIYFSDDNDCAQGKDTYGWTVYLIIMLFIGLFIIGYIVVTTLRLCCHGLAAVADLNQIVGMLGPSDQERGNLAEAL